MPPSDKLSTEVSLLFTKDTELRKRHFDGVFAEDIKTNPLGHVNTVFKKQAELKPLFEKIRAAIKRGEIDKALGLRQIELAQAADVITPSEAKTLKTFDKALMDIIHVDHFAEKDLIRKKQTPARQSTTAKKTPVDKDVKPAVD